MKFFISKKLLPYALVSGLLLLFAFSCKKDEEEAPAIQHETGTVTDVEGNVYKTVKIGNQWWMAENLKVKKYRDSSAVMYVGNLGPGDSAAWSGNVIGAYTILPGSNVVPPGYLYNWFAVTNAHNIAPAGWHMPTDAEWKELEKTLGMSGGEADLSGWRGSNQGEKLKIESPNDWVLYTGVWSTNESGFTARAGGCRLYDARWADPGLSHTGFWWSASGYNATDAWYRYLDYKNSNVFRSASSKNYGFSIRCVKD